MAKDLRTFLDAYEKDHPEDVIGRVNTRFNLRIPCSFLKGNSFECLSYPDFQS